MRLGRGFAHKLTAAALAAALVFGGVATTAVSSLTPRAAAQDVSAQAITTGTIAYVTAAQLNVRQTPTTSAATVTTLVYNTAIYVAIGPVTADGYSWYRIQSESGAGSADYLGWVVSAFLSPTSPAEPSATPSPSVSATPSAAPSGGGFAFGATVSVTANLLNVRSAPTTSASVVTVYPYGQRATISGGPTVANGITWYAVDNRGWVSGQYLQLAGGSTTPPAGQFAVGSTVRVNVATANIRAGAGLSFPANYTAAYGETFTVLEGPVVADGYNWYRVSGLVGAWIAGSLLAQGGTTTPPPSTTFPVGTVVTVTAATLNVRSGAGLGFATTSTAVYGTTFTIYEGPVVADGISWYRIASATSAWVSGSYLARSGGSTPAPGTGFAFGQTVTVTAGTLNVRSLPGLSASIVAVYAYGQTARITSEARTADGITWYAVDNLGWVSAQYLRA
jgi:uncharacterized protein YgiM (DUF1202 family)